MRDSRLEVDRSLASASASPVTDGRVPVTCERGFGAGPYATFGALGGLGGFSPSQALSDSCYLPKVAAGRTRAMIGCEVDGAEGAYAGEVG